MKIGVVREASTGETRSPLMPESVRALVASGVQVHIESRSGDTVAVSDADYEAAGAVVEHDRAELLTSVDVQLCVNRPADDDIARLPCGGDRFLETPG